MKVVGDSCAAEIVGGAWEEESLLGVAGIQGQGGKIEEGGQVSNASQAAVGRHTPCIHDLVCICSYAIQDEYMAFQKSLNPREGDKFTAHMKGTSCCNSHCVKPEKTMLKSYNKELTTVSLYCLMKTVLLKNKSHYRHQTPSIRGSIKEPAN